MTTATYTRPDFTGQSAAAYKAYLDAMARVFERFGDAFAAHQQDQGSPAPEMAVRVDAGFVWSGTALSEVAAQTVSGFTTPSAGQHRIDRVVIDTATGAATRIAGTPATGSPTASPPAVTAGNVPCCQVLITSSDTVITNSMITDERTVPFIAAASDTVAGIIEIATQAEQETGTDATRAVTSGRQHFHPSAAKAWVNFNSAGTIAASYNVVSVSDIGAGNWTINITTDFSSASYVGATTGGRAGAMSLVYNINSTVGAGTFPIIARAADAGTVNTDPDTPNEIHCVVYGDQA